MSGLPEFMLEHSASEYVKNGGPVVSAPSRGGFFADRRRRSSRYRDLKLLMPEEGAMAWTDSMRIPSMPRTRKTP